MRLHWIAPAVGLALLGGVVAAEPHQWRAEWPETDFSCMTSPSPLRSTSSSREANGCRTSRWS